MEIKKLSLIFSALLLSACSIKSTKTSNLESINFHKYAYAICIGSAFKNNEIKEDANRSANGHMEHSNISLEAYQELRNHIDIWLAKKYHSKSEKSLQIMKCNDYFYSGEIQNIYNKYDPCKSKEGWLDITDYNKQCK